MPYKEKKIQRRYITIGDLCKELNIKHSKLRYYEDEGVIKPTIIRGNGRKYDVRQMEVIRFIIKCANTTFFTVNGLRFIGEKMRLPNIIDIEIQDNGDKHIRAGHTL